MTEEEMRMTFTEHLGELRDRLIRSMIAVVIAVVACYIFSDWILAVLKRPLDPVISGVMAPGTVTTTPPVPKTGPSLHWSSGTEQRSPAPPASEAGRSAKPGGGEIAATAPPPAASETATKSRSFSWTVMNPFESIQVKLKIASYGGLVFAFPFILWQLCAFIFPGLKPGERKLVKILLFGCAGLGFLGVSIAYFGVFPLVLPYLLEWTPLWVNVQLRLDETLTIIVKCLAAFALAFQFPMVVLVLVHLDLLSPQTLRQYRKMVIVALSVVAAVLTPPDPLSMTIMLVPLVLLYEASIWMSYVVVRRKNRTTEVLP
jgi:sec-independent protein translocase protein TatC